MRWAAHGGLAGVAIARSQPDRGGAPFRSGARHDREDALRAAQDRIQAELPDPPDPVLPVVRRCAGRSGARRAGAGSVGVEPRPSAGRAQRPGAAGEGQRRGAAAGRGAVALGPAVVLARRRADRRCGSSPDGVHSAAAAGGRDRRARAPVPGDNRQRAGRSARLVRHAGDRLYRMLVEPVLPWIPPGTRVVMAADGALHGMNFETLPVAGRDAPLLDRRRRDPDGARAVVAVGRARGAEARAGAAAARRSGAAGARVSGAAVCGGGNRERLEVLPGRWRDRLPGRRASPAAYRAAAPERFSFVHFTAHAATNLKSPLDSAVILAGPDEPTSSTRATSRRCRCAPARDRVGVPQRRRARLLRRGAGRIRLGVPARRREPRHRRVWDVDDRSTAELMDVCTRTSPQVTAPRTHCARRSWRSSRRAATTRSRYLLGPVPALHGRGVP